MSSLKRIFLLIILILLRFWFIIMMKEGEEMTDRNKKIFAKNFNYYLSVKGKTQNDIVEAFGITASTVSDWAKGKKYPRVDKMQMLADYFGVLKSDLIEEHIETQLTDDIELQEYLEELKNRSEMRLLFKTAKKTTKENIQKTVKILEALKDE